jgi:hypothetical protein
VSRSAIGLATVCVSLLLAAPAFGTTTIGSSHFPAAPDVEAPCGMPCPLALISERIDGKQVTAPAGVIVKWRVQGSGALTLAVYRPSEHTATRLRATKVGASDVVTGGGALAIAEGPARIPVAQGDVVGVLVPEDSKLYAIGKPMGDSAAWGAPPAPDGSIDTTDIAVAEFLYQADVEPDADGDGFGDETQDKCPSQTTTQGACADLPPPPPPPPAALSVATLRTTNVGASKTGTVSIALKNPNAYAITGTLTLKQGRTTVASGKFSLGARASKLVSAKLSRAARRTLARKRKLSLKLTIATRGPAGTQSRSATKTITVRPGKTKVP